MKYSSHTRWHSRVSQLLRHNSEDDFTRRAKRGTHILYTCRGVYVVGVLVGLPHLRNVMGLEPNASYSWGESLWLLVAVIVSGLSGLALLLFDQELLRGKFRLAWTAKAHSLASRSKAGDINAQYLLGRSFLKGEFGIESSERDGIEWLDRAAESGHPEAQFYLATELDRNMSVQYSYGVRKGFWQENTKPNQVFIKDLPSGDMTYGDACSIWAEGEAVELYKKAAEQGHVAAIIELGKKSSKDDLEEEFDAEVLEYFYYGLAVRIASSGRGRTHHDLDAMMQAPIGFLNLGFGLEYYNWRDVQEWKQKFDWLKEDMSPSDLEKAQELLAPRAPKILNQLNQRDER